MSDGLRRRNFGADPRVVDSRGADRRRKLYGRGGGILSVGRRRSSPGFSPQDQQMLMSVTGQLALVIENAKLVERMVEEERLRRRTRTPGNFATSSSHAFESGARARARTTTLRSSSSRSNSPQPIR
ncbi:MAG TPA: GAF domain-containing protein [Pyrinomonadaceae bacterium]|nr:GAF domain-containing protein [Pyrinomonadaceae bacterium]